MGRSIQLLTRGLLLLVILSGSLTVANAQGGGTLSCGFDSTGTISAQTPVNEWVLVLKEAQTVTLTQTQTSGDLDAYLILNSFEGATIAENDDGPNMGYNAQIVQVLEGGRYTIRATRFGQQTGSSTGNYTLTVECGTTSVPVVSQPGTATEGVLYEEDFSDTTGTWWLGETDNGNVWIDGGELHILNYTTAQYTADTDAAQSFGDFTWTVDSRLVGGALDNWHYFSFRNQDASNNYRVGYSADGWFMGEVYRDGAVVETWAEPTQTAAIVQGVGATNRVRIEAIGAAVRFYVNDQLLIDVVVSPANVIPAGDIGLAVASMNGADYSEVAFDNIVVTGPGGTTGGSTGGTTGGTTGVVTLPTDAAFADDFSTDTGAWWLVSDERGDITIQNGELIIRDVYDDIAFSTGPTDLFGDFTIDVDSRFVSGTDNNWHFVVFRLTDTAKSTSYYRVGYSADGYIVGTEFINGVGTDWLEPTQSSAVIAGVGAVNHMRVQVSGTHVVFTLNGQVVLDTYAFTELPAGELWLSANALEAPDTTVAWDNVVITVP